MAKFQLCSQDEYGQRSIMATSNDIQNIIKHAKTFVTDANVNNALSEDDRQRNWEAYFPFIQSKSKNKMFLYGGPGALNKPVFYSFNEKTMEVEKIDFEDIPSASVQIYLGNISKSRREEKDWIGTDVKKRVIASLDHPDLKNKTVFFVNVVS